MGPSVNKNFKIFKLKFCRKKYKNLKNNKYIKYSILKGNLKYLLNQKLKNINLNYLNLCFNYKIMKSIYSSIIINKNDTYSYKIKERVSL